MLDRESACGCVCDPGLWSFTLQPRYKRAQHKKKQWHTHRTQARMQKESTIKDSRNTFKHFIMSAMQVLCVCVLHVPAHVSGRLWGCVDGWMERSGRALASSCYHTRSHPNLSARPEKERERRERSVFDHELLQITVQWLKSHATHWGLENGNTDKSNLSAHTLSLRHTYLLCTLHFSPSLTDSSPLLFSHQANGTSKTKLLTSS